MPARSMPLLAVAAAVLLLMMPSVSLAQSVVISTDGTQNCTIFNQGVGYPNLNETIIVVDPAVNETRFEFCDVLWGNITFLVQDRSAPNVPVWELVFHKCRFGGGSLVFKSYVTTGDLSKISVLHEQGEMKSLIHAGSVVLGNTQTASRVTLAATQMKISASESAMSVFAGRAEDIMLRTEAFSTIHALDSVATGYGYPMPETCIAISVVARHVHEVSLWSADSQLRGTIDQGTARTAAALSVLSPTDELRGQSVSIHAEGKTDNEVHLVSTANPEMALCHSVGVFNGVGTATMDLVGVCITSYGQVKHEASRGRLSSTLSVGAVGHLISMLKALDVFIHAKDATQTETTQGGGRSATLTMAIGSYADCPDNTCTDAGALVQAPDALIVVGDKVALSATSKNLDYINLAGGIGARSSSLFGNADTLMLVDRARIIRVGNVGKYMRSSSNDDRATGVLLGIAATGMSQTSGRVRIEAKNSVLLSSGSTGLVGEGSATVDHESAIAVLGIAAYAAGGTLSQSWIFADDALFSASCGTAPILYSAEGIARVAVAVLGIANFAESYTDASFFVSAHRAQFLMYDDKKAESDAKLQGNGAGASVGIAAASYSGGNAVGALYANDVTVALMGQSSNVEVYAGGQFVSSAAAGIAGAAMSPTSYDLSATGHLIVNVNDAKLLGLAVADHVKTSVHEQSASAVVGVACFALSGDISISDCTARNLTATMHGKVTVGPVPTTGGPGGAMVLLGAVSNARSVGSATATLLVDGSVVTTDPGEGIDGSVSLTEEQSAAAVAGFAVHADGAELTPDPVTATLSANDVKLIIASSAPLQTEGVNRVAVASAGLAGGSYSGGTGTATTTLNANNVVISITDAPIRVTAATQAVAAAGGIAANSIAATGTAVVSLSAANVLIEVIEAGTMSGTLNGGGTNTVMIAAGISAGGIGSGGAITPTFDVTDRVLRVCDSGVVAPHDSTTIPNISTGANDFNETGPCASPSIAPLVFDTAPFLQIQADALATALDMGCRLPPTPTATVTLPPPPTEPMATPAPVPDPTPAPKTEDVKTPAPKTEDVKTPAPKETLVIKTPVPKTEEVKTPVPMDGPTPVPVQTLNPWGDGNPDVVIWVGVPWPPRPTPAPPVTDPSPTGDDKWTPAPKTEEVKTPAPKTEDVKTPAPKTEEMKTPAPKETMVIKTPAPKTEEVKTPAPKETEPRKPTEPSPPTPVPKFTAIAATIGATIGAFPTPAPKPTEPAPPTPAPKPTEPAPPTKPPLTLPPKMTFGQFTAVFGTFPVPPTPVPKPTEPMPTTVAPKPTEPMPPTPVPKPTEPAPPTPVPKPTEPAPPTPAPKPTEPAPPTPVPKPTEPGATSSSSSSGFGGQGHAGTPRPMPPTPNPKPTEPAPKTPEPKPTEPAPQTPKPKPTEPQPTPKSPMTIAGTLRPTPTPKPTESKKTPAPTWTWASDTGVLTPRPSPHDDTFPTPPPNIFSVPVKGPFKPDVKWDVKIDCGFLNATVAVNVNEADNGEIQSFDTMVIVDTPMPPLPGGLGDADKCVMRFCVYHPDGSVTCYEETVVVSLVFPTIDVDITSVPTDTGVIITGTVKPTGDVPNIDVALTMSMVAPISLLSSSTDPTCTKNKGEFHCDKGSVWNPVKQQVMSRRQSGPGTNNSVNASVELLIPSFFGGNIDVVVDATAANSNLHYSGRATYNTALGLMSPVDVRVGDDTFVAAPPTPAPTNSSNATGPNPSPSRPAVTSPPNKQFTARGIFMPEGSSTGLHFVIVTTIIYLLVVLIGKLIGCCMGKKPVAIEPEKIGKFRFAVQHHLWVSVIVPCHRHCTAIHATNLYAAVIISYAACLGLIELTMSLPSLPRFILLVAISCLAMLIPRGMVAYHFFAFVFPPLPLLPKMNDIAKKPFETEDAVKQVDWNAIDDSGVEEQGQAAAKKSTGPSAKYAKGSSDVDVMDLEAEDDLHAAAEAQAEADGVAIVVDEQEANAASESRSTGGDVTEKVLDPEFTAAPVQTMRGHGYLMVLLFSFALAVGVILGTQGWSDDDESLFWRAVPLAWLANVVVGEPLGLLVTLVFRWVSEDHDKASLSDMLYEWHPYSGEIRLR